MPDTDGWLIRRAREGDLASVRELFAELDHVQRRWRVFPPRATMRAEMEERYRAALDDPDRALLVAEERGDILGMALAEVGRPSSFSDHSAVEVSSVFVRPRPAAVAWGRLW